MNDADMDPYYAIRSTTEGTACAFRGHALRILLTGHDTSGAFALIERYARPGEGIPPHFHAEEDETLYVLEGELELWTPDRAIRIGVGGTAFLPRHLPHRYTAVGERPCRFLLVITPAGLEQFFREANRLEEDGANNPLLSSLCAEYGIYFLVDFEDVADRNIP